MISVRNQDINELELITVMAYLEKRGTHHADIYKGNDCVWVASGSANCPINEYFVFRQGTLVDIQID